MMVSPSQSQPPPLGEGSSRLPSSHSSSDSDAEAGRRRAAAAAAAPAAAGQAGKSSTNDNGSCTPQGHLPGKSGHPSSDVNPRRTAQFSARSLPGEGPWGATSSSANNSGENGNVGRKRGKTGDANVLLSPRRREQSPATPSRERRGSPTMRQAPLLLRSPNTPRRVGDRRPHVEFSPTAPKSPTARANAAEAHAPPKRRRLDCEGKYAPVVSVSCPNGTTVPLCPRDGDRSASPLIIGRGKHGIPKTAVLVTRECSLRLREQLNEENGCVEVSALGSVACRVTRSSAPGEAIFIAGADCKDAPPSSQPSVTVGDGDIIEPYERPVDWNLEEATKIGCYYPFKINVEWPGKENNDQRAPNEFRVGVGEEKREIETGSRANLAGEETENDALRSADGAVSRSTGGQSPRRLRPRPRPNDGEKSPATNQAPVRRSGRLRRSTDRRRESLPAAQEPTTEPASAPARRRSKRLCLDEGGRANVGGCANPSSTQIPTRDQCGGDARDGSDALGGHAPGGDESASGTRVEGEHGANDADGSDHSEGDNSNKSSGKTPLHADSARDAPRKIATEEEVVRRMRRLLQVKEKLKAAKSKEEKQHIREVEAFFVEAARIAFRDGTYDNIFDDLGRLVDKCGPGLYALLYKLGVPLKVGMSSVDRKVRADQQNYKVAYNVCGMEKLNELCPVDSDAVKGIMGLGPPGLVFHPDKHHEAIEIIQLQVGEALINSFYETSTGTVGERIMMWPSERIEGITTLRPATYFTSDDIAFLDDALFEWFLTWSTYKYDLAKRRETEEVLLRLLPESPEDRFLKLHMLRRAFGSERVQEFVDAIEDSVRSEQMKGLIGQLKVVLGKAKDNLGDDEGINSLPIETVHDVRNIIGSIDKDSDDYSHYKPPELERLAEAAAPKLRTFIENATNKTVIVWERHMFDAVEKYESEAFDELIPPDSERVEVIRGTDHLLRITCTMPGGKVVRHLIVRSYYRIFAEETSKEVRISVADAYVGLLSYLCAGGIITREHAEREALVLRSFLMEWEGLDGDIDGEVKGSVRAARNHAVGEGMCVGGVPRNLVSVSQLLQIGYQETADVRSSLGRELFDVLATCFGVPAGPNNPTPLEAGFRCGGVIEVGHLPARECRHKDCRDDEQPYFQLVGKTKEDFLLPAFQCPCCLQSTYLREVATICQRIESMGYQSVTSAQMQRALACRKLPASQRLRASIEQVVAERQRIAEYKAKEPKRQRRAKQYAKKKRNTNEILQMEDEEEKEHFEATGFSFGLARDKKLPAGWSANTSFTKFMDPDGITIYRSLKAARAAATD